MFRSPKRTQIRNIYDYLYRMAYVNELEFEDVDNMQNQYELAVELIEQMFDEEWPLSTTKERARTFRAIVSQRQKENNPSQAVYKLVGWSSESLHLAWRRHNLPGLPTDKNID